MKARAGWFAAAALTVLGALVVLAPAPARADSGPGGGGGSGGSGGGDRPAGLFKVEGRLAAVNLALRRVTIVSFGGRVVTLQIVPGTKVERNDRRVPLTAFRIGDRAQALFFRNGVAWKFEAVGR